MQTDVYNTFLSRQMLPIPGTKAPQTRNHAGGFAFALDKWARLNRFLILGTESNTYYVTQQQLTSDNVHSVIQCIMEDGVRVVEQVIAISKSGRAPKKLPAIFTLALTAAHGSEVVRRAALAAIPKVCRTGSNLFCFVEYVSQMRGWGRGLRKAIARWYTHKDLQPLVYQVIKYQRRNNWHHRDLLRLCHPLPPDQDFSKLFQWIIHSKFDIENCATKLLQLKGFILARRAIETSQVVELIREYRLPREAIDTRWLKNADVWRALLEDMPMTAMIRNLATMTRVGLLTACSSATKTVVARLQNSDLIRKAKIHPIQVLAASMTYESGRGKLSKNTWHPLTQITSALEQAFYAAFANVKPTGKRLLLAIDVSGSMSCGAITGILELTPRIGCAALAMVTAKTEPNYHILGFSHQLVPVDICAQDTLNDALNKIDDIPMGATDCALPILWALQQKKAIDTFVVYTDCETWYGNVHPCEALREYRRQMNIPAKLIVVGMVSNGFSIADPGDPDTMDIVGFDTAIPQLMHNFITEGFC